MKKHRRVRHYNKWRCDSSSDYGNKLSPAERDWLDKFEREYYCGESHGLHPESYQEELYRSINVAARDIVTAVPDAVEKQVKLINKAYINSKEPSLLSRWYHTQDYQPKVQILEDEEVTDG